MAISLVAFAVLAVRVEKVHEAVDDEHDERGQHDRAHHLAGSRNSQHHEKLQSTSPPFLATSPAMYSSNSVLTALWTISLLLRSGYAAFTASQRLSGTDTDSFMSALLSICSPKPASQHRERCSLVV